MKRRITSLLFIVTTLPVFAQSKGSMPVPLMDGAPQTKKLAKTTEMQTLSQAEKFDQSVLIQRYGTILDRRLVGAGGLTAWTVEKNGRKVVLYTTADSQAIISGIVWDSLTGRNLSDKFITDAPNVAPPIGGTHTQSPVSQLQTTPPPGALIGAYSGAIPESIKTIDSLMGVKEGKGGPADTLYVIYDPRCPYCRKAYAMTRDYVKRGFTIKWIPALALGNPGQGIPLAAVVLQTKPGDQSETLRRVLGNKEEIVTTPTKSTEEALKRNLDFFFAAFQNNGVEQAGVPAAFFLDKRTGKPRMMTGVSEQPVIESIFGKL